MSNAMLDRMERELLEQVAEIQRDYQKQIDPYVKRLAEIRSLRPPQPIMVDIKDLPAGLFEWIKQMPEFERRLE